MRCRRPFNVSFVLVTVMILVSAGILGAQEITPAGHWEGSIHTPDGIGINVDLKLEEGIWVGDIGIPAQMAQDITLGDVVVDGSKVSFVMPGVPGDPAFDGALSEDGNQISGMFSQGGASFEFSLTRSDEG
jgi:hypothetical protein